MDYNKYNFEYDRVTTYYTDIPRWWEFWKTPTVVHQWTGWIPVSADNAADLLGGRNFLDIGIEKLNEKGALWYVVPVLLHGVMRFSRREEK